MRGDFMAKYFSKEEMVCKCCGRGWDVLNPILLESLDKLREKYGKPIYVSNAYRCPAHNYAVGGVENSQHVLGNAADIYVDGDYNEFYVFVLNSKLFDGIGYYPDDEFIHVDTRSGGTEPNEYWWCG